MEYSETSYGDNLCMKGHQPPFKTIKRKEKGDFTKSLREEQWKLAIKKIQYSASYYDDNYEYRHVVLPRFIASLVKVDRLLQENEWRAMGVQQSHGWQHYAIHRPEPHIMLFRRPHQPHNVEKINNKQQPTQKIK